MIGGKGKKERKKERKKTESWERKKEDALKQWRKGRNNTED